jgi:hypothetical protein
MRKHPMYSQGACLKIVHLHAPMAVETHHPPCLSQQDARLCNHHHHGNKQNIPTLPYSLSSLSQFLTKRKRQQQKNVFSVLKVVVAATFYMRVKIVVSSNLFVTDIKFEKKTFLCS